MNIREKDLHYVLYGNTNTLKHHLRKRFKLRSLNQMKPTRVVGENLEIFGRKKKEKENNSLKYFGLVLNIFHSHRGVNNNDHCLACMQEDKSILDPNLFSHNVSIQEFMGFSEKINWDDIIIIIIKSCHL